MGESEELRDGEFVSDTEVRTGETTEFQGPEPPQVAVDLRTGQLPAGWSFADD